MKIDGHTHTELCPHGSRESTEKMIQKAIQLGFDHYCITEHAPLPLAFSQRYKGNPLGLSTASLAWEDLDAYFDLAEGLQKKYADQIQISVGFEVDYLPGFEKETRAFLNQYGPRTQQNILSVHFMAGTDDAMWCLDFDTDDFQAAFSSLLSDPQKLYARYFQLVYGSAAADLGPYRPQRIGHMSLIKKYADFFKLPDDFGADSLALINRTLDLLAKQGRELDFNTAGLYKTYCNDFYPGRQICQLAQKKGIPLVFGSDAHAISEVGRGYHLTQMLN
ncbi:histidinol-phosphatase HisJ [Oenococcus kitaharae]|uniref:Histidinol-phosphatase n=1 Tax=Oenococcus kitaharae DSM 17330 TaxID=1045004 RepID=G9WGE7_9LACO|nr:histidinol-phosphatase HisJ [Oenococcus kitaharae]EHN59774.1 Histidinol-phosphatase [Oenococcus kitaharae DSM 17330]OEY83598.1 histidinol phosphatase [Oenococcus kitaharae]OEY85396.1 histidinol phosphatase [Oenococcus kitaharae]OEY86249.1 histidinol phosphatase [Oenococcus kitaharae]